MSNTRLLKLLLITVYVGLFLFFSVQEGIAQPGDYGTPRVEKYVFPSSVESGNPVSVVITVEGFTGEVDTPIPFDGALLIDMSSSMFNESPYSDPTDLRLDAAKAFINCIAPQTRLAIITFSGNAELIQELTSNKPTLLSKIDQLYEGAYGATNIYDAMQIAQTHLLTDASPQRVKYIILLTDGMDTTGHTDLDIINLATTISFSDIHYLTIALGGYADLGLLIAIADITGGDWYTSAEPQELLDVYDTICDYASFVIKTRQITLEEKLASGLRVVPGSVSVDIEGITQSQIDNFEESGYIEAYIGTLGSGDSRHIWFSVVSDCLSPDSEEEEVEVRVDDPRSKVTYIFGNSIGEVILPDRRFMCTRPGDLWVGKFYDSESALLSIILESRYPSWAEDSTIRNIRVIENPSIFFQPNLSSASPPIDLAFRGFETDLLVWNIPELGPAEVKTLTIELESRICSSQYYPPIDVNAQKYTGYWPGDIYYTRPDGTSDSIEMPLVSTYLSTVDPCVGRPDIHIVSAYTRGEYWSPPEIDPTSILFKYESEKIWVDSRAGNGFWDGTNENVGDFISGAHLQGERIVVSGQGDLFHLASENAIIAEIINTGQQSSEILPGGVKLFAYNYDSPPSWEIIGTTTLPAVQSLDEYARAHELVKIELPPNTLQSAHLRPYALSLDEAMQLISILDSSLAWDIRVWAFTHPSEWDSLSQGMIGPKDLRDALPFPWWDPRGWLTRDNLRQRFNNFLNFASLREMAWGKPSFTAKILFEAADSEKHTNNNWATEKIIVDKYPAREIMLVLWFNYLRAWLWGARALIVSVLSLIIGGIIIYSRARTS